MKCGWYEHNFVEKCQCVSKIVMHKSFGEVSLVEQDTIENVSVAYIKFKMKFPKENLPFFNLHFMRLFSADAKIFLKIN